MPHILVRFNKSRGNPGRGTADHVWRVFVHGKEYLVKHLDIRVPVRDEISDNQHGIDWNIACDGELTLERNTSTAIIARTAEAAE